MTRQEVEQALDAYAAAKNAHDIERIVELRSDDCVDYAPATGMRIEGKQGIEAFFTAFFASVPDYHGDFDGTAYGDDTAVVWGHWGGTTAGPLFGLDVEAGRTLRVPCAFVCTFRDGKLVMDLQYSDAATMAEQLGVELEAIRPTPARTS